MIDWWLIARNAVWIAGAAILVWSWSYTRWLMVTTGGPRNELGLFIGFVLICFGQASLGGRWWETAGWVLLAVVGSLQLWHSARVVS